MRCGLTIGLLPCYLRLYDELNPDTRNAFRPFLGDIVSGLEREKATVVEAPICCVDSEFQQAMSTFEAHQVDVIVSVHLAYSPSEEAVKSLCRTDLPLIILDTTMDEHFGQDVDPTKLLYNHGIHGVMDMASLLRRWGRPFQIVAGHLRTSNVLARVAEHGRAVLAARELMENRALRIGQPFRGMGDFSVVPELLAERFGLTIDQIEPEDLVPYANGLSEDDIKQEMEHDRELYEVKAPDDVHRRSVIVGLAIRQLLDERGYDAFSMNFQSFIADQAPINTVPFLEAEKAMARGVGYAGEGDVFTATLVGALSRGFGMTTFTEIFCPDWAGNSLFLSHMGEINPEVIPGRPLLLEKDYTLSPTLNPAHITGAPGSGPAVYVNLVPGPENSFDLILAPVDVLPDSGRDEFKPWIRGWMRPQVEIAEFLEADPRAGGTHHAALVLGDRLEALMAFAEHLDLPCTVIA